MHALKLKNTYIFCLTYIVIFQKKIKNDEFFTETIRGTKLIEDWKKYDQKSWRCIYYNEQRLRTSNAITCNAINKNCGENIIDI